MNEALSVLRTVISAARAIDMFKKTIIAVTALVCGFYVIKLWQK